jgi:cyclopropane-fatty-acyl-phospholipid synthase
MKTIALTALSPRKRSFYESVVLNMVTKMQKGHLLLTLPDGEEMEFGNGREGIRAKIWIRNKAFFKSVILYGDIGFGESYVDGYWETDNITNVIQWFLLNLDNVPVISGANAKTWALNTLKLTNKLYHTGRVNSLSGSKKNISAHYDLNNHFFALFLDPSMTYSSAYFREEGLSLEEAQLEKYERLCKQLHLKATDHVLEIGSGWGANAIYMAKNYGCRVTSLTISEEQYKLAKERVEAEGLSDRVEILIQDYRLMEGEFDKIVSIEMIEAVGHEFLPTYFKKCSDLLKKDGIFAFQVITSPDSRYDAIRKGVDWIQKYIFPGSLLPSVGAINSAINKTSDFTLVDLKDMGLDYARTLKIWFDKFNENIKEVKSLGFDETFIRKWNYYLNYCEAAFAMRNINVMQMTYTRPNNINR